MEWLRAFVALGVLAAFAGAAAGWGELVCRATRLHGVPWTISATLGVAAWVFLGGVLNLARLAYPWTLDALVVLGWALAAWQAWGRQRTAEPLASRPPARARLARAVPWAAVLGVGLFVALTLVPPRAYNVHDDLLTYLVHPVRMLETGTVFGSPVSALGRIGLGGKALLDGFLLAHLPVTYVGAVDTFFGLVLALAILVAWASRPEPSPVAALLAMALLIAINPQAVNVTALYSAAALALTLLLLSSSSPGDARGWERARLLVPASLLAAALVALKPTYLPFAALQLLATTAAEAVDRRTLRPLLVDGAISGGLAIAFLSPWLALHAPHYLAATRAATAGSPGPSFAVVDPLDPTPLFYGDSVLLFTGAAALPLAVGLALLAAGHRGGRERAAGATRVAAALVGATLTYALLLLIPAVYGAAPERIVRFACPILIAAAPAAIVLGWRELPPLLPAGPARWARAALAAAALLVAGSFAPGLAARVAQASEHHSILAFRRAATTWTWPGSRTPGRPCRPPGSSCGATAAWASGPRRPAAT